MHNILQTVINVHELVRLMSDWHTISSLMCHLRSCRIEVVLEFSKNTLFILKWKLKKIIACTWWLMSFLIFYCHVLTINIKRLWLTSLGSKLLTQMMTNLMIKKNKIYRYEIMVTYDRLFHLKMFCFRRSIVNWQDGKLKTIESIHTFK